MIRISSRTSRGTIGRPGLPCRTFQVQNSRKPLRCQAITVAALTMKTLVRHSLQTDESQAHRIRSVVDSFGFFTDRAERRVDGAERGSQPGASPACGMMPRASRIEPKRPARMRTEAR